MFDFDLNMRIWRGAMDAAFAYAEAAMAGTAAFQQHLERSDNANFNPEINPGTWPLVSWPASKDHVSSNAFTFAPGPAFNPWAMTAAWWQSMFRQDQSAMPMAWMPPAWPGASNDGLNVFFAWQPWSIAFAQQPIMFALMAFGMPFGVASPMARATASMLDAGDAMRQQSANMWGGALSKPDYLDPGFWQTRWLN